MKLILNNAWTLGHSGGEVGNESFDKYAGKQRPFSWGIPIGLRQEC